MGVVVIIFNSFVANYFKQNWVNCWPPFPFESLIIVAFSGAAMLSRATSKEIAAFLAEKKYIYTHLGTLGWLSGAVTLAAYPGSWF